MAGRVMTVAGEISATALGFTLPHEHLLCDLRALWHPPGPDQAHLLPYVDADPTPESIGPLCSDPYVCRPNLLLEDPSLAARELAHFRQAGGQSLIELTTAGLSPRPNALREIAHHSGIHIIAGCGWYRQVTQPPSLAESSETELTTDLVRTIREGFPSVPVPTTLPALVPGTSGASAKAVGPPPTERVRPGIIGEIGTGDPVHPDELKALRAAARAQAETGLAIAVHLALWGRQGPLVLDTLQHASASLERVMLCHLSEQPDAFDYHRQLLDRGAFISFDTFGAEYSLDSIGRRLATDEERLNGLRHLLDTGYATQLLISQDICERMQLRAYGGYGYAHLATTILPRLRRLAVPDFTLTQLTHHNPARLLAY